MKTSKVFDLIIGIIVIAFAALLLGDAILTTNNPSQSGALAK